MIDWPGYPARPWDWLAHHRPGGHPKLRDRCGLPLSAR